MHFPWQKERKQIFTHWCSPKLVWRIIAVIDIISPRNRYTWSLCIRLKYCGLQTLQNSLLHYTEPQKKVFSWYVYSYPHQSIIGMKQTYACSNLDSLLKIHCRWESQVHSIWPDHFSRQKNKTGYELPKHGQNKALAFQTYIKGSGRNIHIHRHLWHKGETHNLVRKGWVFQ